MAPLAGQVALVTGASAGIGRAVAVGLAAAGASVALLGRDRGRLAAALAEATAAGEPHGARALAVPADVTERAAVAEAVTQVELDLGPLDLLVNNAGLIERDEVPVWEADPDEWWRVVETNVRGPFLLSRAVVAGMAARGGGRVVDLSTGSALRDSPIYSAYYASKTALARLTASVALAGEEHGVRAFGLSPGVVRTDMTAGMAIHDDRSDWTPPEHTVELVVAIAEGRLDALSGRQLRAGSDDVDTLRARADAIVAADARTLRLRPYGDDDPLG